MLTKYGNWHDEEHVDVEKLGVGNICQILCERTIFR